MKKIQMIFLNIIIFLSCILLLNINNVVYAAGISVSSSTINVGESTTITIRIPDGYVGYSGSVSFNGDVLEYTGSSCGGKASSGSVTVADINTNLEQVGNLTLTFKAKKSGTSNISANLKLSDKNNTATSSSGSGSITVKSNEPVNTAPANPAPEQPANQQPENKPEPAPAPAEKPQTDTNNNNSAPSSTPTPTPAPKPNTTSTATTAPEPNFTSVNETVYATTGLNVRASWDKSSKAIGYLYKNGSVKRIGIGDNGWSKVKYEGKTAYISSKYLTTTKPVEEPKVENSTDTTTETTIIEGEVPEKVEEVTTENNGENKDENKEDVKDENTEQEETVETFSEKTEEEIYQEIVSSVGTIPEVGNNKNLYIAITITVISAIIISFIFRKEA